MKAMEPGRVLLLDRRILDRWAFAEHKPEGDRQSFQERSDVKEVLL
jgi:hypothetical protein